MNRFTGEFRKFRDSSWSLTTAVFLLVILGVMFVSSASEAAGESYSGLWRRHLLRIALGICFYGFFSLFDYRNLRKAAWGLYALAIALLVLVLMVGKVVNNAKSWLMIFGFGLQPAEVAKFAVIVLLAAVLSRPNFSVNSAGGLALTVSAGLLPFILIVIQPDIGTAAVFIPLTLVMAFAGGVSLRALGYGLGMMLLAVVLLLSALFLPRKLGMEEETCRRIARYTLLSEYQRDRIVAFFRPEQDPLGVGWSKMQSKIAVGSGGWTGKGYGKGTQSALGYLPSTVAPTDFIYSVIAEETGFAGAFAVLLLFGAAAGKGLLIAVNTRNRMGRLLCVGVVTVIFTHVFINTAMTIGLIPITGLPLPLISYGGTFTVVTMAGLGVIQSVCIYSRRSYGMER
ncbi:MAG: FtsW/RodA/SpoVE family cell cycle protein [Kiritimatiellia bacterium]